MSHLIGHFLPRILPAYTHFHPSLPIDRRDQSTLDEEDTDRCDLRVTGLNLVPADPPLSGSFLLIPGPMLRFESPLH